MNLKKLFSIDITANQAFKRYLNFILVLLVLGFIYLVNSIMMEYKIAKYNKLQKQLKELRTKYSYTNMRLARYTLRSEVEKKVKEMNLNLVMPKEPPKIVEIKK